MLNGNQIHHSTIVQNESVNNLNNQLSHNTILPPPINRLNWLIHLQYVRSEMDVCKQLIQKEIEKSKDKNEYAIFKQGIILKKEGKKQEALNAFQKSLKLNPTNVIILKEIATCLFEMKRYRLALNTYLETEAVLKAPDWEIYYFIALCSLQLNNINEAKEYIIKSIHIGKQENAYELLIKILISENNLKSAIDVCNSAIGFCTESVNLMTECGLLHFKCDQLNDSFERFSQALALQPIHDKALLGISCITLKHEEFDVALSKLKMAVLYNPESIALWNNIGICFFYKQKFVAAISCLKRALYISPLNWRVLSNLALVHLMINQPASAFNFAAAAANLRPENSVCFTLLAYTLHHLKDNINALKSMKHAFTLAPIDAYMAANTVLFCEIIGNQLEADKFIQKYQELMADKQNSSSTVLNILIKNIIATRNLERNESETVQESDGLEQNNINEIHQLTDTSNIINDLSNDETDLLENEV